jgi:hypothetical protein
MNIGDMVTAIGDANPYEIIEIKMTKVKDGIFTTYRLSNGNTYLKEHLSHDRNKTSGR